MRVYLSTKEAGLIRVTLMMNLACMTKPQQETVHKIIDRMDLCEKLQQAEKEAKVNVY